MAPGGQTAENPSANSLKKKDLQAKMQECLRFQRVSAQRKVSYMQDDAFQIFVIGNDRLEKWLNYRAKATVKCFVMMESRPM